MDESKIIEKLKQTMHYEVSLVFKDAVDMLEKMPEHSRERHVMGLIMSGYARANNWRIVDNGETEMLLMLFNEKAN